MLRQCLRTRVLALLLCALLVIKSSSCGTLLHPERVGQPRSGRIDPAVAVLDGVGLLLFVIPGAVAFAVDFYTGAIYLPAGYGAVGEASGEAVQQATVYVDPDELTAERIEQVVATQTGEEIRLEPGEYRTARINDLSEWEEVAAELEVKMGVLVHPIRLACTGKKVGPSLFHLMEVLGKEKVMARTEAIMPRLSDA